MRGGCFDCEKKEEILKSTTVSNVPRETSRGKVAPGAGSVALCEACYAKEKGGRR